tara:strand:- start:192 stop:353 length:162 start_codon:yes stop_codon:yes gene_type:complete
MLYGFDFNPINQGYEDEFEISDPLMEDESIDDDEEEENEEEDDDDGWDIDEGK